jgi:DtxR family transcriptional regulator, Mn-dependent transcriptional regulator
MSQTMMTRLPSEEQEFIQEALSEIYESLEKRINNAQDVESILDQKVVPHILEKLKSLGHIDLSEKIISLTSSGEQMALQVVRRKRLAERLMKDVLNLKDEVIDPAACQWEHILSKEVTNSICTLLGHPSHSPNELAIPPGECCKKETKEIHQVICSLETLKRGDKGKITYLLLKQRPELNRLLSMGLIPGANIELIQLFPTFVIQVNESQLAFDEEIAKAIFVHPL